MQRLYDLSKTAALRCLPASTLTYLKKVHYLRKVQGITCVDEPDLGILEYLATSGDCVVDIGANIGVYSANLSRLVGGCGHVYAFEPVATTFAFLQHNINGLGLTNVIAKQVAVSDHNGPIQMMIPCDSNGIKNYYQAMAIEKSPTNVADNSVTVPSMTLDDLLSKHIDSVTFVKCDAEGHELHCLRGAKKLLHSSQPSWLIEVSGNPENPDGNASRVFSVFKEAGYTPWIYENRLITPWTQPLRPINYLFLSSKHVERLRAQNIVSAAT